MFVFSKDKWQQTTEHKPEHLDWVELLDGLEVAPDYRTDCKVFRPVAKGYRAYLILPEWVEEVGEDE